MKATRKNVVQLMLATGLAVSSALVYAQSVQTPYSPDGVGTALSPQEEMQLQDTISTGVNAEECITPYSPNECGPAESPGVGGTMAPAMGGTVEGGSSQEGGSLNALPETPDSNWDANTIDD